MSNLAQPISQQHLSAEGWIDLKEAARRAGYSSDGVLRRFHLPKFIASGSARQIKRAKGKPIWQVHESADPKFSRVKQPSQLQFDSRHLSDKHRAMLNDRLRIIREWEERRAAGVKLNLAETKITASYLHDLLIEENRTLSRATLFNWLASYRLEGIAGLVDARWTSAEDAASADPFIDEVKRLFLSQHGFKIRDCHKFASLKAEEKGWTVRSYDACKRAIKLIPEPVRLKMRFGEEAYTNGAAPYIERDYSSLASNEVWVGDHHQFDVHVCDPNRPGKFTRPWLTAWQDARSRKIVGFCVFAHDPNQDTILRAFRAGVRDHGVPQVVYVDNGKDYDSYALQGQTKQQRRKTRVSFDSQQVTGIFTQLQVRTVHCQPYHGQSKPIERFFGTLENQFCRTWETYCGRSPEHRPENFGDKLKAGRAPTLEDFSAAFADWLTAFHGAEHTGDAMDGMSPDQAFAACLETRVTASPELLDYLCLKPTQPVKVQQNGVAYRGLRFGQFEPALHKMIGKQVVLRIDDADLSRVIVSDLSGKFICVAPSNARVPFMGDSQMLRDATSEKKRMRRVATDYSQVRTRLSEDLPDLMTRAAMKRNRDAGSDRIDPSLPPPTLKPVRTALESQLPSIQKAFAPRIAVGAESMSLSADYASQNTHVERPSSLGDISSYLKNRSEARDE